ncbi:AMP-binding protein [Kibdelosporangium phytohabitans]|uniref:Acyl-CoA synthetase n=1 Tax=Kibdelosporangium phytohabitans TaxID=860235 RepID=A0A0N9HZE1_9PSEU|nr:AMP-binding protein [Kibdelosporangium phytohabitans]ALG11109.1 acyl-CoA synthetase [Kibdelosporangium phytohabitans]
MRSDSVETRAVVRHPPERVWEVISDPELYPRYVPGLSWCERLTQHHGRGARYLTRVGFDDEVEITMFRHAEHLAWSSTHRQTHRLSIMLKPAPRGGTEINIMLTLLVDAFSANTVRRNVEGALVRLRDHLDGAPVALPPVPRDPATARGSTLSIAKTLAKAGALAPGRPDRMLRQLAQLTKWGATIAGGYQASAVRIPNEIAYHDELTSHSFADVEERTNRMANLLAKYWVTEGSRVALMCRNHGTMLEAFIACGKLGADVLLMNTGLGGAQIAEVIRQHDPALLMVDDEFTNLTAYLPQSLPRIRTWAEPFGRGPNVEELIAHGNPDRITPPKKPGRVVVLTSGTSGTPKGARRPTPRGLGNAAAVLSRIPLRAGEKMLVAAPMFHTWGLAAIQLGMPLRSTLVLQRRFHPQSALQAIQEHRCTSMFAVPIMLQRMVDLPQAVRDRYDTSSLRVVASSGSALPGRLADKFMDAFGDILYNLYGSTEVSWGTIATPADMRAARTTAGMPPLGTRIAILDGRGAPTPPGVVGRIFVGNDMLFDGYTNGANLALRHSLMDTGDRGYLDADGRLFVEGRDDEMIVSGGENVFPGPVEEVLTALPQVLEAAVVGVPDHEYGQRLAAYLVLRPGARLDADFVRRYVHERLARFAVPRDVVFVGDLPRNATGKILRQILEDGHW